MANDRLILKQNSPNRRRDCCLRRNKTKFSFVFFFQLVLQIIHVITTKMNFRVLFFVLLLLQVSHFHRNTYLNIIKFNYIARL